jgi:hypothetical protein
MRSRIIAGLAGSVVLLGAGVTAASAATVDADLVEQNRTGANGSVTLTVTGAGDLRVSVRARGLLPGPHAQHVHGAVGAGHFACASLNDDTDGDGWLTNEEATGEYGNVFLALTTRGDTSSGSGLAMDRMPVADPQGRLSYDRTIPAAMLPPGLVESLSHLHVVLHGIDANDNGKYDMEALGESSFASSLGVQGVPEEATNPAACGMVAGVGAGEVPVGGVETGGGAIEPGPDGPLAALGGALLVLGFALGLAFRGRDRRGAG